MIFYACFYWTAGTSGNNTYLVKTSKVRHVVQLNNIFQGQLENVDASKF